MARPVLSVKGYTPLVIKGLFRDDEKYTIGIRLYAVYQVSLGKPSRDLEELYTNSFKQITNCVHQFEKDGIEGLRDKEGGKGLVVYEEEDNAQQIRQVFEGRESLVLENVLPFPKT